MNEIKVNRAEDLTIRQAFDLVVRISINHVEEQKPLASYLISALVEWYIRCNTEVPQVIFERMSASEKEEALKRKTQFRESVKKMSFMEIILAISLYFNMFSHFPGFAEQKISNYSQ